MDYLDVIVHVFTPEAREFYRLEQLWGEAPRAAPSRERRRSRDGPGRAAIVASARRAPEVELAGIRTPDLVTASHALSQLSYSPRAVRRQSYRVPARGRHQALPHRSHGEHRYDPRAIEPQWQAIWEREQTWHVSNDDAAGVARSPTCSRCSRTRRASPTWGT